MIDDLARKFFISHEPCPAEIPNCEELRREYTKSLDSLKISGCAPCAERNLKNKFITKLKTILEQKQ